MMKFITLNNLILDLQEACGEIGNWRVESIGASSDGKYVFHLASNNGENKELRVNQFEAKE